MLLRSAGVVTQVKRPQVLWNRLGKFVSIVILVIAIFTLIRLLRGIEFETFIAELKTKSAQTLFLSGAFVAIAYVTLTLYDLFALRAIGCRTIPYRIAALAGFTGYTIGHNLGATVFTAGLVRFRIYSAWGLNLIDIAKIAFLTGLTFWLGNAVLGIGMAWAPEAASAVNQFPEWINRLIGLSGLIVIMGYLLWLTPRPRPVGVSSLRLVLPNAPMTLVQIGIGVLDLTASAIAMYALLPAYPAIDIVRFLVIFVTAVLLGFLSHAPGSLGVLETAMLVGLPQFQKEALLASLLIFRALYFILPGIIAAGVLGLRELCLLIEARNSR